MATSSCPARAATQPCAASVLLPAWRVPKRSVESRMKASSDFLRSSDRSSFGWPNIGSVSAGSASAQRAGAAKIIWYDNKSAPAKKLRHKPPADLVLLLMQYVQLRTNPDWLCFFCGTGFLDTLKLVGLF